MLWPAGRKRKGAAPAKAARVPAAKGQIGKKKLKNLHASGGTEGKAAPAAADRQPAAAASPPKPAPVNSIFPLTPACPASFGNYGR